jgi:cyclopropane-fatty-acyl-phospholipid synthase
MSLQYSSLPDLDMAAGVASTTPAPLAANDRELRTSPQAFRSALAIAQRRWDRGSLTFELPSGREIHVNGRASGPSARLIVRDFKFVSRVLASADIGFGEGYVAGEWDTPDLAALLEAFTLNFDHLEKLITGNPIIIAVNNVAHFLNRNSKTGSRRNIQAHYDLGNAFYERWLDPSMTYSSAMYRHPGESLRDAQENKYRALADCIGLQSGQHVLEIGCGWGGFAEYAAKARGARVTAITISKEQHDYARRRRFAAGLADRADVRLMDYRDLEGRFDAVASIEMFEAVGEAYWPTFFNKVAEVLKPGARAGLQIITIRDDLFKVYRQRSDFMRKYVFPGGMLPSEHRLGQETARAGLEHVGLTRFGQDYARTLADWARRFEASWREGEPGFDDRFQRLWRFYLRYCEAAFLTGRTNVIQLALQKA